MKSSIFALTVVLCSTLSRSDAFAIPSATCTHQSTTRNTVVTSLDATTNTQNQKNKNNGNGAASFAAAVALGWGIATTATIMTPSVAFAAEEYVDFSMPSYKTALVSPINASMKGDNMLMKNPFGGTVSTDGSQEVKA